MQNWKALMPIVLSLAIAITGSVYLYQWINRHAAPKEIIKVEAEAAPVMVAAMDLPWGTQITPEMIKTQSFLRGSLPSGYFAASEGLVGRILIANVKQGDPLVEHRLAPLDVKTGGVSAVLPSGKRAVAVKGDKVIGISGFINPGNRVDVLVTMQDPATRKEKTKIVLENIPVLATGTQIEHNSKGNPAPVDVYTLEVTPVESEKLALASAKGKLQFALRNIIDAEKVRTSGATITKTLNSLTGPAPSRKAQPVRPTRTNVEIIKGTSVSRQNVRLKS